ncbi:MAG: hypothetical protein OEY44_04955 [Candidatus Peregrinibacteria bacterium]|nr:hypothetical protein [Candidatus Peregrinibacteria bacterium]
MSHDNPDLDKKRATILERLESALQEADEEIDSHGQKEHLRRSLVVGSRRHLRAVLDAVPEVLVLDDEELILRTVGRIFKSMKPTSRDAVTTIDDPVKGEAHIAQMPVFSMVVSDNQMGVAGYTGAEIAERLHPVTRTNRLTYAINSSDDERDFDRLLESRAVDAFFPKDVFKQENLERLARIFVKKVQESDS